MSWLGRIGSFVGGIVLVAGAVAVQTQVLTEEERAEPVAVKGTIGDVIDADRVSVHAQSVEAISSITGRARFGRTPVTAQTDQIFVRLKAKLMAAKEPQNMKSAIWQDRNGNRYEVTDKVETNQKPIQPGFWVEREYFFEVPRGALAGSRILFPVPSQAIIGMVQEPFPPEADIDTGLDDAAANRLIQAAKPYRQPRGS